MMNWLGVEPRHLVALIAVKREGSFRAAAAGLGLAQSGFSQRIVQLEQIVRASLVERSRGHAHVRLTDAGNALAAHAEEILAGFDAALADLRVMAAGAQPALRVGVHESAASLLVGPAIKRLAAEEPGLRIDFTESAGAGGFFALVSSGELDAAFADLPLERGPFAFRELRVDPWALVVRADSPLARRREPPTLAEIGALPLVAPSSLTATIGEHLRAGGVEPRFAYRSEADAGVQALVANGVGIALMPRPTVNARDPRIAVVALDAVLPPRRIVLYWHRDRREVQAIMRFAEALAVPAEPTRSAA